MEQKKKVVDIKVNDKLPSEVVNMPGKMTIGPALLIRFSSENSNTVVNVSRK